MSVTSISKGLYSLELGYADPTVSGAPTGTLYCASHKSFVTSPSSTPANTVFLPVLIDPGSYERYLYKSNTLGGQSQSARGDIVLNNADGSLDSWINYAYDNRPLTLRFGTPSGAFPGGLTTLMSGTAMQANFTWDKVVIALRDMQAQVAQKWMMSTTFAGTNSGSTGVEGTAQDLKGKFKPVLYGVCYNMFIPCVNTSNLVYQISNLPINSIQTVYDKGVAITADSSQSSLANLLASTPGAGKYNYYLGTTNVDGAYIKLASTPAGQITCDATEGTNAAARSVAQIQLRIFTGPGGLVSGSGGNVDDAAFTALDALNSSVAGIWCDINGMRVGDALDALSRSIGSWWAQTRAGQMTVGRLTVPTGTSVLTIESYEILNTIERIVPQDQGLVIPPWRVQVNYQKNYTVQTATDLAAGAGLARVNFATQEFRSSIAQSADTLVAHPLSETMIVDSLLTTELAAATEASRLQNMYGSRRDLLNVSVPRSLSSSIELGNIVTLQADRYDWTSGKKFYVIGLNEQYAQVNDILTLWG